MSLFNVDEFGVITMDSAELLESLQESYKGALSSTLNLDVSTPQGQLMKADSSFLEYTQEQLVLMASNFSVLTATGKALDTAAGHWGYYRKSGTATVVNVTFTGTNNTVVPKGTTVGDGTYTYNLLQSVFIGTAGTAVGQCQCTAIGAIECLPNTVKYIITPVQGLTSVNNPTAGIMGTDNENDNTFRKRITANWLNIRGVSLLGAIIDNVAALPNVVSVLGRENPSGEPITIDGVELTPHSIYLNVLGGDGSDIAKVLTEKKTLGASTNGATEVVYYDARVGYNNRYQIARPTLLNLGLQVQYKNNTFTPAGVQEKITATILQWINQNPFSIGQVVSGAEIAQALKGFNLIDLLDIKVVNGSTTADYVTLTIAQYPVIASTAITFSVLS